MTVSRAWSYGEVSPSLQKRVDLDSYQRSAKTLRNWKVLREGGLETRQGTKIIAPVKFATQSSIPTVIRRFIFNAEGGNSYAIEVGHQYMRFHKNGRQIRHDGITITGISAAATGVVTYSGSLDPDNGDEVYISGVYGMTEVNGRWFIVTNVNAGANTFELYDRDGNAVSTATYTAYSSGGTFEVVYEIATPYFYDDLYDLVFDQKNDVIAISHASYPPYKLTRSGDTSWTMTPIPTQDLWTTRVYGLAGTPGSGGTKTFKYKVSYESISDGTESMPGTEAALHVTGITNESQPTVTCASHGYSDGDTVVFHGVTSVPEVNGREFTIAVATPYVADTPITIGGGISLANPMVVDIGTAHGLSDGDKISFNISSGTTELNDITYATVTASTPNTFQCYYFGTTTTIDSRVFTAFAAGTVTRISPNPTATNSFTLVNVDSTHWGVFSDPMSQAFVARTTLYVTAAGDPTSTAPNVLTWTMLNTNGLIIGLERSVKDYVIYRETNGVFGFIGTSRAETFSDIGLTPDTADAPFKYSEPFLDPFDYPAACGFGKQRLWFGGPDNHPNRCISSITGNYFNFFGHDTSLPGDGVTIDLVASTANIVRNIKEVAGRVIAFCSEGEFGLGDTDGVIDATQPDAQHFTSNGSSAVTPLLINEIATFIQARGSQVRDFGFNFESNNYKGTERSIRSQHLFRGYTIVDWCYQQTPDSTIWAVRSDGTLLGCTFVREEQMAAWHRHDVTNSAIESVCSIPGDGQDDVYVIVNHTVDGITQRLVEVMAPRLIGDIVDGVFVDAATVYDGRNTGSIQMRLLGGTTWTAGESMTVDADASYFDARFDENVGNSIFLYDTDGSVVKCLITGYAAASQVTVTPDRDVPVSMRGVYTTDWSYAQPYASGLWLLEGAEVSVFGDGFVEASPNNAEFGAPLVVTNGRVELSRAYAVITVGTPFTCDFEPVDIDSAQVPGGGLIYQQKIVNKMSVAVEDSRGLYIGQEAPDGNDPLEDLEPLQHRSLDTNYDDPVPLETDTLSNDSFASWGSHGSFLIRQVDPLPSRILAVMPEGSTGGI